MTAKCSNLHIKRAVGGIGAFFLFCGLVLAVSGPALAQKSKKKTVTLRGLDKITARIITFHAPIDQLIRYGSLTIMARGCRKAPPEDTPEVTAFLEVDDQRPGQTKSERIFTGWMFASSPAVSALEHPVYDVWVTDCSMVSADKILSPHRKSAK